MQRKIIALLFYVMGVQAFGHSQQKNSLTLLAQYNNTIDDITPRNNPWGMGLGIQTLFNARKKLNPSIELTADVYLEDDKVLRVGPNGNPIDGIRSMINIFAGISFKPQQNIYLSLLTGPGFINGRTLLGIKPSFGFYFTKNKRLTGKVSYINIFNRDKTTGKDFSSLSLAMGLKLF